MLNEAFNARLERVRQRRTYRELLGNQTSSSQIDFCSNDYLGIAGQPWIGESHLRMGSTGSRLLSGDRLFLSRFEQVVGEFFEAESALIFSSGYALGVGVLSALTDENDLILMDQSIHACWVDGAKLSKAQVYYFKHNCLDHLSEKLARLRERRKTSLIFIVVESVYSMSGDLAPLQQMVEICKTYDAHLILDEAHAVGVLGELGRGAGVCANLRHQIFARALPFGKGLGSSGAAWLSSKLACDQIVNFCHSFIYTTAPSPAAVAGMDQSLTLLKQHPEWVVDFVNKINLFREVLGAPAVRSPILPLFSGSLVELEKIYDKLRGAGLGVSLIRSPTVRRGCEIIKIVFHRQNTLRDIHKLAEELRDESYQWG